MWRVISTTDLHRGLDIEDLREAKVGELREERERIGLAVVLARHQHRVEADARQDERLEGARLQQATRTVLLRPPTENRPSSPLGGGRGETGARRACTMT